MSQHELRRLLKESGDRGVPLRLMAVAPRQRDLSQNRSNRGPVG
ncbi:hypothetical protein I546_3099 [Mycobacterium kansasii 732]|nr:hypothetical protein I546_3099 [Mycobacterium kansasii 732]